MFQNVLPTSRWVCARLLLPHLPAIHTITQTLDDSLLSHQFLKGRVVDYKSQRGKILPAYEPTGPEDTTLVFESRFESGNLHRAVKV